jgi:hypothetical protein
VRTFLSSDEAEPRSPDRPGASLSYPNSDGESSGVNNFIFEDGVAKIPEWLAPHFPNPRNALFVTLSAGLGLFLLLFDVVQQRQSLALQTWPSTAGVVIASELRSFTKWQDNMQSNFYTPSVVYRYTVGGREYTSDCYSLGAESSWGRPEIAQQKLTR